MEDKLIEKINEVNKNNSNIYTPAELFFIYLFLNRNKKYVSEINVFSNISTAYKHIKILEELDLVKTYRKSKYRYIELTEKGERLGEVLVDKFKTLEYS